MILEERRPGIADSAVFIVLQQDSSCTVSVYFASCFDSWRYLKLLIWWLLIFFFPAAMMFPGVHQYVPHMGMGIGMAMGMDMGMNRPILPFPNILSGSALPTPAAGAHLGPRFPMPTFHMPHVRVPDPSRISPTIQSNPLLSSLALQSQNQARVPNFIDPYQQYFGLRHMQLPLQQNQTPSGSSKPSTSKVGENLEKPPAGWAFAEISGRALAIQVL